MQKKSEKRTDPIQPKGAPYVARATAHVVKETDLDALASALEATAEYLRSARNQPTIAMMRGYQDKLDAANRIIRDLLDLITADYGLAERAGGINAEDERVIWVASTFLSL